MPDLSQLMAQPWFIYAVAGVLALALFLIVWSLGSSAEKVAEEAKYVSVERTGLLLYVTPIIRALAPFAKMVQTDGLNEYRRKLPKKMTTAGMEGFMTPDEYIGFHILCALVPIPLVFYTNFFLLGAREVMSYIIFSLPFMLFGAWYPARYLDMKKEQRHKSIFRDLPYVMDLLTVSVEAGLDFQSGISKVVEKGKPGPLREELKRMLNQLQLGTTRVEALRELSARVQLKDLSSLTAALIQAARLGSSIGPILRIQSEMLRTKRSQIAEEMANKAPVKMIFPIVMFIFPSVFLVLLGPVLIKTIYEARAR
jgi:tight adherence protein C